MTKVGQSPKAWEPGAPTPIWGQQELDAPTPTGGMVSPTWAFSFFPPWPLNTSVSANHISEGRYSLLIYDCSMLIHWVIPKVCFNRHLASSHFDTLKQIARECATPQSQLWVVSSIFYQTPRAQGDDRQTAWLFSKCLFDPVSGKVCASSAWESLGLPSACSSVMAEASTQTRRGSLCTQPCKPRWQAHLESN